MTGTVPYTATVVPTRGQVPAGTTIASVNDSSLRASILATFDDGSAAVVVVAGETGVSANGTKTIYLQTSANSPDTPASAVRIGQVVANITVNFGSAYGVASITDFTAPERIWWANSRVICARYRLPAPSPGSTALEAVIDITAYPSPHSRALVEVVVENSKMASSSPTKPAAATYTGATVSVNGGTAFATVNGTGPASAEGNHAAFRAWYAKSWVGGDPGLRVTQSHADLQNHPLLWRIERPSTFDMNAYASDAYSPWSTGRQRAVGMGGTGDHESIGPLPVWEARALQSGDFRAWQATEASALAALSYNVNYRDSATGLVPTFSAVGTRSIASGTWPSQTNGSDAAMWETAHCPDVGLMAFLGRPSPVFIEIAQKAAFWNGMWSSDSMTGWAPGRNWTPGLFGYWYQIRGRAWGIRSVLHAAYITPGAHAWRSAAVSALETNVDFLLTWTTDPKFKLNTVSDYRPSDPRDYESGSSGFQNSELEVHYLLPEVHKLANSKLLTGSSGTKATTMADWLALGPVRFVNEQPNGAWRYIAYRTSIGDKVTDAVGSTNNWLTSRNYAGAPASVSGSWMVGEGTPTTFASGWQANTTAVAYYPVYFYAALAIARERGVAGAATAWDTIQTNITNLSTWRAAFATDPRWGVTPR